MILLVFLLAWEFDRAYTPPPDRFVITYAAAVGGQTTEAMEVPPSSVAACASLPGASANTYCTQWPTCPPAGEVLQFWVRAAWGEQLSPPSNLYMCHFVQACVCTPVDTLPEPVASTGDVPSPALAVAPTLPVFQPSFPPAPV
jgi:hypothetical protein